MMHIHTMEQAGQPLRKRFKSIDENELKQKVVAISTSRIVDMMPSTSPPEISSTVRGGEGGGPPLPVYNMTTASGITTSSAASSSSTTTTSTTGGANIPRIEDTKTTERANTPTTASATDLSSAPAYNSRNSIKTKTDEAQAEKMIIFLSGKPSSARPKYSKVYKFPMKLFYILECGEYDAIISWMQDGLAFQVLDEELLVRDVLPTVFKQAKFSSFHRKLNRWKFQKLHKKEGAYSHPLFHRGRMDLCHTISIDGSRDGLALSYHDMLSTLNNGPGAGANGGTSFYSEGNSMQGSNPYSTFRPRANSFPQTQIGGNPLWKENNGTPLSSGGHFQTRNRRPGLPAGMQDSYYYPQTNASSSAEGANTSPSAHMPPFFHNGYGGRGDQISYHMPESNYYMQNQGMHTTMPNQSMLMDYNMMHMNNMPNPGQYPTMRPRMNSINGNTGEAMTTMNRMDPRDNIQVPNQASVVGAGQLYHGAHMS